MSSIARLSAYPSPRLGAEGASSRKGCIDLLFWDPFAKVLGQSSVARCAACLLNDDGVNRSCRSGDVLREFVPIKAFAP
jgi:hypothetical protein